MRKSDLLFRAKRYCDVGKHRFTQPRERVLSLLASSIEPMGAYEILERLSCEKQKINPPTIYRAIEFWVQHGFIHKVQSMSAYIACCEHQHHENFCIFICDDCHKVIELKMQHLPKPITMNIEKKHLTIRGSNTEVHGICNRCK